MIKIGDNLSLNPFFQLTIVKNMSKAINSSSKQIKLSSVSTTSRKIQNESKSMESLNLSEQSSDGYRKEIIGSNSANYELYHVNDANEKDGLAYTYENNKIAEIIEYREGKKVRKCKSFRGSEMTEFDDAGIKCYQGEYVNNEERSYLRSGKGKEYIDGCLCYSGDWQNGIKEGEGKSMKNGKAYYIGSWKNNLPEGSGKLLDDSGKVLYEGLWNNGKYRIDGSQVFNYNTGTTQFVVFDMVEVKIKKDNEWNNLSLTVTSLQIGPNCCNTLLILDFSNFTVLQTVEIKRRCFNSVKQCTIQGLPELQSIHISSYCLQNSELNQDDSFFIIKDCKSLKEIIIDESSCIFLSKFIVDSIIIIIIILTRFTFIIYSSNR